MKNIKIDAKMIGRRIMVTNSRNKCLVGMKGKVIDETKNMLTVKTDNGEKKLIKKQVEIVVK